MYRFLSSQLSKHWNNTSNPTATATPTDDTDDSPPPFSILPTLALLRANSLTFHILITGQTEYREEVYNRLCFAEQLSLQFVGSSSHSRESRERLVQQMIAMGCHCHCFCEGEQQEDHPRPSLDRHTQSELILRNLEVDAVADSALAALFLGLNLMKRKSYVSAGLAFRRSWRIFQKIRHFVPVSWYECSASGEAGDGVAEEEEEEVEGEMSEFRLDRDVIGKIAYGIGLFLFMVGLLPDLVQKLLWILGFRADCEKGIALLQSTCANPTDFMAGHAAVVLAIKYLYIPRGVSDVTEGPLQYKQILDRMTEMYPASAVFELIACQAAKKIGQMQTAIEHIRNALNSCELAGIEAPNNLLCEYGQCCFFLGDYEQAMEIFRPLTEKTFESAAIASLELAICQVRMNLDIRDVIASVKRANTRNHEARNSKIADFVGYKLKMVNGLAKDRSLRKSRHEEIVYDEDKLRVVLDFVGFDIAYMLRELNHMSADRAESALSCFEDLLSRIDVIRTPDVQIGCHVVLAELLRKTGASADVVKEELRKAIAMENAVRWDRHWPASALYALGELMYFSEDYVEALSLMKRASSYSRYSLEDVVKARVKVTVRALIEKIRVREKT